MLESCKGTHLLFPFPYNPRRSSSPSRALNYYYNLHNFITSFSNATIAYTFYVTPAIDKTHCNDVVASLTGDMTANPLTEEMGKHALIRCTWKSNARKDTAPAA